MEDDDDFCFLFAHTECVERNIFALLRQFIVETNKALQSHSYRIHTFYVLYFLGRGILSMANSGPNTNKSQLWVLKLFSPLLVNVSSGEL